MARKSVVYDGKIILIIEGLENFMDFETGLESSIRFWLLKFFPSKFRVITTAAKTSKSYRYLKDIGCKIIELRAGPKMMMSKLDSLKKRNYFCTEEQRDKVIDIMTERIQNKEITSLFMKVGISCYSPYASNGIVSYDEVDDEEVQKIIEGIDLKA